MWNTFKNNKNKVLCREISIQDFPELLIHLSGGVTNTEWQNTGILDANIKNARDLGLNVVYFD